MCTLLHPHDMCVWGDIRIISAPFFVSLLPLFFPSLSPSQLLHPAYHPRRSSSLPPQLVDPSSWFASTLRLPPNWRPFICDSNWFLVEHFEISINKSQLSVHVSMARNWWIFGGISWVGYLLGIFFSFGLMILNAWC